MQARILDGNKIRTTTDPAEIRAALAADRRIWIELERQTPEADALLTEVLKLHPLTVEDIWHDRQRPRIDDFDDYLYVIVHGIGAAKDKLRTVEIDIVIGPNWLVSHDPIWVVADDVGTELDRSVRVMAKGVAWIAHALLDRAIDGYLPVLDQLDSEVGHLEDEVLEQTGTQSSRAVLARILSSRRRLQELRRMGIHQRELLMRLSRGDFDELPPDSLPFFRDVYDHFLRINDVAEGYRELVSSALDAYLSVQSNRMSEVMKTLTLMSTVMLPLTFIAGVYGMNFKHMPELEWMIGYPGVLAVMALVAGGILLWFYRRGWIGNGGD